MFRSRVFWMLFLVGALAVVGGYGYVRTTSVEALTADGGESVQTAPVRQGSLVVSATGAGTTVAPAEIEVSFQQSGVLVEVLVEVGEPVVAGQVLARLDDTDARRAVAQAEQTLRIQQASLATLMATPAPDEVAVAEATLRSAEAALADLAGGSDAADLAAAEAGLRSAQSALSQAQAGPDASAVTAARASLSSAEAALAALLAGPGENDLIQLRASLERAEAALQQAQANYDRVANRPDISGRPESLALQQATIDHESALASYNSASAPPSEAQISAAQAQVESARAGLNQLLTDSGQPSAIASAQAQVASAQANLEGLQAAAGLSQIASAEAQVAQARLTLSQLEAGPSSQQIETAEAQLEQARLSLEQAERSLAQMELVAPVAGTVLAISADVGESPGTAPLITLADLSQSLVEIYLDESDLDKVAVGYDVEVIFDAFPDRTFPGQVVQVDPRLTVVSSVTTVRALVRLDGDAVGTLNLPLGMTGTVDVIGGRATNVALVPVEALREITPGQFAVFVMEGESPTLRPVEVGLRDFTFAEITAGLEVGETVTTGIVETR